MKSMISVQSCNAARLLTARVRVDTVEACPAAARHASAFAAEVANVTVREVAYSGACETTIRHGRNVIGHVHPLASEKLMSRITKLSGCKRPTNFARGSMIISG